MRKASGNAKQSDPSVGSGSAEVEARIEEVGGWRGEMLARLRAVIKQADPEVVEECKWKKASNPLGVPRCWMTRQGCSTPAWTGMCGGRSIFMKALW
jgi:hypothetical protein